jgi:ubiquitin C-terminal hydrolase
MKKLWLGSHNRISPAKIRDLISEKYSQFSSYEQQDAQEFMNALLSFLHEDLNRIEKRPYYEPIDGDGWDDKRLADESWRLFLSRDDSVIVDNFYGQFKSKLTCLECNKVSFTPFF